jgi:glutamine amidotransferase
LFEGIPSGSHAYFLHSYAMNPALSSDVLATTDYGGAVTAAVARDNYAGTQFHPEKSQAIGIALLGNFLVWRP